MLDGHTFSLQSAQLFRQRIYDNRFTLQVRHPNNVPDWTYIEQENPDDTDFSAPKTPADDIGDDEVDE